MKDTILATKKDGIELCSIIYPHLKDVGFFPALTGGLLYKDGPRKDIDIVIYRHRQQVAEFELKELEGLLSELGLYHFDHYGFVSKCKWKGFTVDLFNPESDLSSEYGDLE